VKVTDEHIGRAFDQVETISSLHHGKPAMEQFNAVKAFQEYLGMTEEANARLHTRIESFVPEPLVAVASGWLVVGFMLGLAAAQNAVEPE
jgi:hypothetical protein